MDEFKEMFIKRIDSLGNKEEIIKIFDEALDEYDNLKIGEIELEYFEE